MRRQLRVDRGTDAPDLPHADEERKLDVRGLFYGIGHQPNSGIVEGQIELDDKGYVVVCIHRPPTPRRFLGPLCCGHKRTMVLSLQCHAGGR